MTRDTVRFGIVGCGWAAGSFAESCKKIGVSIVAVTDIDRPRAEEMARLTGAEISAGLEVLVDRTDIDAVYISLPHSLLASAVERALQRGKHVLAEKPLALDAKVARRLGDLAEQRGLKLAVFFVLRRAATVLLARRLVRNGEIGEVRTVRIATLIDKKVSYWGTPEAPTWRASKAISGGGVLLMNTIHQIDTLRFVTGLDFASALGAIDTLVAPADVEDIGMAILRLANGGLVGITANAHSPGARDAETISIEGTLGRLDIPDPFGTAPVRLFRQSSGAWEEFAVERQDCYGPMIADFVDAVRHDGAVPATAGDAAAALATLNAIYASARSGAVVAV
jgi:predicted dehydrogenase